MKNYINFEGKKIALSDEQIEQIRAAVSEKATKSETTLESVQIGATFKLGEYEFIVLEHKDGNTAVILKDLLVKRAEFGENNNYSCSNVDNLCVEFGEKIADIVGRENLIEHTVDLTSDDGLKDYGTVTRFMSLITCDMYRRYVEIFDEYKIEKWWWLVTPNSTPKHDDSTWIKCVAPLGNFCISYYNDNNGVRPFCILKSNIFVSK